MINTPFKTVLGGLLALSALAAALPAHAGKTLDTIKQRGQLVCGVNPSLPGFSAADARATGQAWTSTSARRWPPAC